ncbi:hypothetical protein K461DRAFT_289585 [Myriangium duriaei CBS 260.36]|uniref:Uncharacterized protein n=1 Tax=Myriangium duriaei CBS 260.36 TaxID=1168546 RepID=A0A9P4JAU1_9PEZI|nr:hypothetical protein K461DRAFT_289585 [Myriangium duriaei CBS 260.36]
MLFLAAAAGLSAAMPTKETHKKVTEPQTTPADFFQGPLVFSGLSLNSTEGSCGTKVASGTITEGACNDLHTLSIGIHQRADKQCTFTMWTGTHTCDGAGKSEEIIIPSGTDSTCINTGVLDGGKWYVASGIYKC